MHVVIEVLDLWNMSELVATSSAGAAIVTVVSVLILTLIKPLSC